MGSSLLLTTSFSANGQNLPWSNAFQSFQMMKSIGDEADRAVWQFWGLSQEAIAKAALSVNQMLSFQWANGDNQSIPHSYVIHSIDVKYLQQQALCTLHLMDCRLHMMANSAFSSFPHQSFSQIVSSIASSYSQLPAAIVRADKYIADVLQTGSHHWGFLSALKKEGCKAQDNGDSDYRLFFRGGNELHFHPPDYTQSPYKTVYVLAGSTVPEVNLRLAPWKPIIRGSIGYTSGQFLRDSNTPYKKDSSQSSGAFSGEISLGTKTGAAQPLASSMVGSFLGKFFHTHTPTQQLIDQSSTVGAEQALYDSDSMEFTTIGDPGVEPGNLVKVVYTDTSGTPLEADGLWLVEQVYHNIVNGEGMNGKTKLKLSRTATAYIGSEKIQGLNSSNSGSGGNSAVSGAHASGGYVRQASGTT